MRLIQNAAAGFIVLGIAPMAAIPAHAATCVGVGVNDRCADVGTINPNDSAGWTFNFDNTGQAFYVNFTPGPSGTGGDSTSVSSKIGANPEITSITAELFNGSGVTGLGSLFTGPQILSNEGSPTFAFPAFTFSGITPGNNYVIKFVATLSSLAVGSKTLSGTVSIVPLPAAAWLFGSAFLGLCWLGRRSGMRGVGMLPAS